MLDQVEVRRLEALPLGADDQTIAAAQSGLLGAAKDEVGALAFGNSATFFQELGIGEDIEAQLFALRASSTLSTLAFMLSAMPTGMVDSSMMIWSRFIWWARWFSHLEYVLQFGATIFAGGCAYRNELYLAAVRLRLYL